VSESRNLSVEYRDGCLVKENAWNVILLEDIRTWKIVMASKKVVADGETKDEVDEVTDIKFESEDDDDGNGMLPHHSSEILDTDIDGEIELFLKQ